MSQRNPTISKGIDWLLVWLYVILTCIGIASIFATTYREGDNVVQSFISLKTDYSRQLLFFVIALILGTFILLTDSKFFTATANLAYSFGILLLLLVFPFHSNVKGTQSIIRFGSAFQLQPAELCKLFVNLALAKYLSRVETDFRKTKSQLIAAMIAVAPALLSIAQHETGLALVYFSFFLVMYREGLPAGVLIVGFAVAALVVATLVLPANMLALILIGIAGLTIYIMRKQIKRQRGLLATIIIICAICVGIQRFAVPFIFKHVLQRYQVERIYSTIGKDVPEEYASASKSEEDPVKAQKTKAAQEYNVKQSKIAIGSGGLIGKGLLKGTQTRNGFVPEQRTDFIFCTIGEGFGFMGSFVLLGVYLLLLMRIVTVAERQRSVFSRCYAYGVASVIFFHITINICMTIGLAPV
ncbi:MAG: rod shape-determining protein RodA, partial [Bacteroidetes bacterium]|nr:rod shape-determining protein RodA [Bacteroidota bacterium]